MKLTQEFIDGVFDNAASQEDYLLAIYRRCIHDWDEHQGEAWKLRGWPRIHNKTWEYIARKAMDWDRQHVSALPGGAWINWGFSSDNTLAEWDVDVSGIEWVVAETAAV